jgi:hypothetical protein
VGYLAGGSVTDIRSAMDSLIAGWYSPSATMACTQAHAVGQQATHARDQCKVQGLAYLPQVVAPLGMSTRTMHCPELLQRPCYSMMQWHK